VAGALRTAVVVECFGLQGERGKTESLSIGNVSARYSKAHLITANNGAADGVAITVCTCDRSYSVRLDVATKS